MARYIDAELLDPEDFENCTPYQAREIIEDIPTADVVPKSEVAREYGNALQTAFNDGRLEGGKEVAREIFSEIEKTIIKFPAMTNDGYMYFVNFDKFAELKKKYQEGEPNGQNIKE